MLLNLSWKDVFNSQKVFPKDYHECRAIAKSVGYNYIAFNGRVYDIYDKTQSSIICYEEDL